uniref:(northern house mosquito) hypothetical protein n=1 Tax=Culex pipiens TaxID=7175 RepID=A0A8D8J1X7_CULPI
MGRRGRASLSSSANGTRPTRRQFGVARFATRWPPSSSINTRITNSTRSKIIPKWTMIPITCTSRWIRTASRGLVRHRPTRSATCEQFRCHRRTARIRKLRQVRGPVLTTAIAGRPRRTSYTTMTLTRSRATTRVTRITIGRTTAGWTLATLNCRTLRRPVVRCTL